MVDQDLIQRRFERERKARKQAEVLLEQKSRDLFEANQKLQALAESLEQKVEQRTAELEKERKLAVAAAEAKSKFLAMMSHEIRTPMNGVLGTLELLDRNDLDIHQRDLIETATGSAESLLEIIDDILDFSKIEAGKLELEQISFDLVDLLTKTSAAMATMAEDKGLVLRTDFDNSVFGYVTGDPLRLRQVLTNLIANATKFTEHGEISIEVGHVDEEFIRFSVTDTGCGIPDENRNHIFGEFSQADDSTTRKFGGTGLGLAICARLAALMGGEIGVESKPGAGSTFWFTARLPRESTVPEIVPSPIVDEAKSVTHVRVLLVEDNPTNRKILTLFLTKMDIGFEVACNGAEAVKKIADARSDFDLVLMDAQMPVMDGYEATAQIRAAEAAAPGLTRMPIVALTANAMRGDREKCIAAGMDDYMTKPVRADALDTMIRKWAGDAVEVVA